MIKRYSRITIQSEINMIPLLDVLLILLLVFMVTSPFMIKNIKVDLPEIDSVKSEKIKNSDKPPVIFEISNSGQYSMIVDNRRQEQLSLEDVISEARFRITINPQTSFMIGGDKEVPYEEIIKILNVLNKVGAKSIGLIINPTITSS